MDDQDSHSLSPEQRRVVLHVDMDCFYCQVECRRLSLDPSQPMAVQQWDGLIAVNYAAKALGITRHMRVNEAKAKFQDLKLVHVETIGVDPGGGRDDPASEQPSTNPKRSDQKACLERYRLANREILDVLHAELPNATIEKASIDEVYVDVSSVVDEELQHFGGQITDDDKVFSWNSVIFDNAYLSSRDHCSLRLSLGAKIASRVRRAIRKRCGFTSSAGIATNKLLAKVASALNKPDKQTLIHPRTVPRLMRQLPLRKLGGLGGKLGEDIEELIFSVHPKLVDGINNGNPSPPMVSDILLIPPTVLMTCVGKERGSWALQLARGEDHAPVIEKERTKSMLAAKSFEPTSDIGSIRKWLDILSYELEGRMKTDQAAYRRRPKTLVLTYRSLTKSREQSRRTEMPRFKDSEPCRRSLADAGMALFKAAAADESGIMPCVRLALTAQDFVDLPNEKTSIKRFFSSSSDIIATTATESHGGPGTGGGGPELERHGSRKPASDQTADVLAGIDIKKQAELLKEASMLHRMGLNPSASIQTKNANRPAKKHKAKTKTRDLASFFTKA